MHHVMFDIDGTLVMSCEFDAECYLEAVQDVLGHGLDFDWTRYKHISDAGILDQCIGESGLDAEREKIHADVKKAFSGRIANHLRRHRAEQVPGASEFLNALRRTENLSLSIATGGWYETAVMKLESAGIDFSDIPIASSNDHYSRTEIMKLAGGSAVLDGGYRCTYFGDGEWDKIACEQLGFNFVLVGEKADHHQRIQDFSDPEQAMSFIGLRLAHAGGSHEARFDLSSPVRSVVEHRADSSAVTGPRSLIHGSVFSLSITRSRFRA